MNGYIEYRFVPAGWTHPDGYKFTVIGDPLAIEAHADRADRWLIRCGDQVKLCAEVGHTAVPGGCNLALDGNVWACAAYLERARTCTRTPERTTLVRIEVPT